MQDFINQFHFLRPLWLLAIVPALALAYLLWQQKRRSGYWHRFIQADLLQHLLEQQLGKNSRWQLYGLIAAWLLACIALAGPSWQRLPQAVHKSEAAVVILYDMSPSMVAQDIKPSRLQRAQYKLRDYLRQREEGLTALIAYAGDAHVVSPLTDDTATIANLLPALHPGMMPAPGSNVEAAVEKALDLFSGAGASEGEILLVTDGVAEEALPEIRRLLSNKRIRLSVLGIGTAEGAPIPTGDGGFLRSRSNDIVIARLNRGDLRNLSADLGGTYAELRYDDSDIEHLLAHTEQQEMLNQQRRMVERQFDTWQDNGRWLAVLLLPFALFAFRRGWLLTVAALGFMGMMVPAPAQAQSWDDLWLRSDQQGLRHLERGEPEAAARAFKSHDWRGSALYRAEDYEAAAQAFAEGDSARDHYNRGNALAKAGRLHEALEAYEAALERQPDFPDATFNAELVRELLEQLAQQGSSGANSEDQQSQAQPDSAAGDSQDQPGDSDDSDGGDSEAELAEGSENQDEADSEVNEEAARDLADRQTDEAEQQGSEQAQQSQEQPVDYDAELADGFEAGPDPEDRERQQALEQWLRQVPDDPSGLLRRKFEYEYRRNQQQRWGSSWTNNPQPGSERW